MPYDAKPLDPFDPASAAVDIEGCEDDVDVLKSILSSFKLISID